MSHMSSKSKRMVPVALFTVFYLVSFAWLERTPTRYHIISSSLDQKIPFCEYFIIPYLLWFFYIAGTVVFFMWFNESRTEYVNLILNLGLGMTLFLVVSYIYPNGLAIRPAVFPRDNIFTDMVRFLYRIDTATNVLPSIHVYNSVAAFCAIQDCQKLQKHPYIRSSAFVLTVLIILSTMFLKQHSICDVATGITLSVASYVMIYKNHRIPADAKQRTSLRHT